MAVVYNFGYWLRRMIDLFQHTRVSRIYVSLILHFHKPLQSLSKIPVALVSQWTEVLPQVVEHGTEMVSGGNVLLHWDIYLVSISWRSWTWQSTQVQN